MKILQNIQNIIKKLLFLLNKEQKFWGVVVATLSICGAMFEMLGVSIILPLVQAMIDPAILWKNTIVNNVAGTLGIVNNEQLIVFIGIIVIIIYILKNLFLLLVAYVRIKYAVKIQRELSTEMLTSYMRRGYTFFLNSNTSVLLRGMSGSIQSTYNALFQGFKILSEIVTVICICGYIMITDLAMALCIVVLAGICLLTIVFGFRRWMVNCGEKEFYYSAQVNRILLQAFQGIKEVMVMQKQDFFVENYKTKYTHKQKAIVGQNLAAESPAYLIEGVCIMGMIVAVCFKILNTNEPALLVPQLAAFAVAAFRILPSLGRISSSFNQLIFSMPGVNETYENFEKVRKEKEQLNLELNITEEPASCFEELLLKNILWKYDENGTNILDSLNLKIKKGQAIALIGESGAGKTTVADIILGLLHPQSGVVTMNQKNIDCMPKQWGEIVGYVPQNVYIMDDTIRSNIAFGVENEQINDDLVWLALKQARMEKFVKELPQGLDTILGDRGMKCSGGQRQRIAIARALYRNPDILVLDEATSALDTDTETAVMESIEELQGKKTLIIIAHRLSTIYNCDVIYEIINGKAVERSKDMLFK